MECYNATIMVRDKEFHSSVSSVLLLRQALHFIISIFYTVCSRNSIMMVLPLEVCKALLIPIARSAPDATIFASDLFPR